MVPGPEGLRYRTIRWVGETYSGHAHVTPTSIGLARTIHIRCVYGICGRKITKYTVIYGVYKRFWPTQQLEVQDYQVGG